MKHWYFLKNKCSMCDYPLTTIIMSCGKDDPHPVGIFEELNGIWITMERIQCPLHKTSATHIVHNFQEPTFLVIFDEREIQ
jgi:hypothetical protein